MGAVRMHAVSDGLDRGYTEVFEGAVIDRR